MGRKPKLDTTPRFVVIDEDGLIFTGLSKGEPQWSWDWEKAKPLIKENTRCLLTYFKNTKLINYKDL